VSLLACGAAVDTIGDADDRGFAMQGFYVP
jgi:hypothetical protein